MAIKLPADGRIIDDDRLTAIAVISHLSKTLVEGDGGLKAAVKADLKSARAEFAQSDLAIARFQSGERSTVSPEKLWRLVEKDKITIAQFLKCISVQRKPLEEFLPGGEIDKIATSVKTDGALYVELKPDVLDADAVAGLAESLVDALRRQTPKKAA